MDRLSAGFARLWGPLDGTGKLHGKPRFAAELAKLVDGDLELCAKSVSLWSYGKQVEHVYLACHWVLDRLHESMNSMPTLQPINVARVGFLMGAPLPRGVYPTIAELVAKSGTRDEILGLRESLDERLAKLEWTWDQVETSVGNSFHPWMHYLTPKQWFFFLDAHNRHHTKILRDIVAVGTEGSREGPAMADLVKIKMLKTVLGATRPTPEPNQRAAEVRNGWLSGNCASVSAPST